MMEALKRILRMIKFEHTLFALPLAFAGAVVGADGWPGWWNCLFILLAMVGARSAAMSFNRLVDLPFDEKNPRTRDREIPAGRLGRWAVWFFLWCSIALFFLSALALGRWCLYLSPIALVVILGYSYTKRFTWACHIFLGLSLAIAPAGGFLAVTGTVKLPVVVLSLGVLFWVAGFDIIYACQDVSFDRKMGLRSLPAWVGQGRALAVSALFHLLSFLLFVAAGWMDGLSWPYFAGTAAVGALLVWEHRIVSGGELERIDLAFFTINSYVSVLLLAGVIAATSVA
jgi:4-hydroxybenzoate polyprenyltransferase